MILLILQGLFCSCHSNWLLKEPSSATLLWILGHLGHWQGRKCTKKICSLSWHGGYFGLCRQNHEDFLCRKFWVFFSLSYPHLVSLFLPIIFTSVPSHSLLVLSTDDLFNTLLLAVARNPGRDWSCTAEKAVKEGCLLGPQLLSEKGAKKSWLWTRHC